ncbi:MAG: pseudouridine synthase [Rhodoferax sp.]|nr:pseudouridine synthase [Rhodoferax sp.]
MTQPSGHFVPPTRNGVGPSCVGLPTGAWPTMLDFLSERFAAIARETWQARMMAGEVWDEHGAAVTVNRPYQPHLRLYYYRSVPLETPIPFQAGVVFQDEHLLVVDKPHFLPVAPSGDYLQETVLVRLKRQFGIDALSPIHRIDRDTAGLVLFSLQKATRDAYQALFRQRRVHKTYEAIAPWRADLPLPLTRHSRIEEAGHFMLQREVDGEPNATTHIALLSTLTHEGQTLGHYQLTPVTGQRHQLRVHMAALGLPILGDGLYPMLTPAGHIDYARPLQLLAKSIEFIDPLTGVRRHFDSARQLALARRLDL